MSSNQAKRKNPYKGARAFEIGETIFGRAREIAELLDLLIAERIVLLHSPSGAGKTSLVQAGLVPALTKARFAVLPVIRVNHEPPADIDQADVTFNRYIYSALLSLEEARPAEERLAESEIRATSLAAYLEKREAAQPSSARVLVFDQFEEILTGNATDTEHKEAFFNQVGEALSNRRCWALFAMREDYVGALSPYLRRIPTRLTTTYRLDLLGITAARLAIQNPARASGVDFHDDAAKQLVDDLRILRVQGPDGILQEEKGDFVEPVQLQVVCYRLWEKLKADVSDIRKVDIETGEDVNQALAGYFAQSVKTIAKKEKISERKIREWFTNALITAQGLRGQVMASGEVSQGLATKVIWELVNVYLVRAEKRRNAVWFELAHDRLIEPVIQNNAEWLKTNLNEFQRQAALWSLQNRPDRLLLHGPALTKAVEWADRNPTALTDTERAFLSRCLEARTEEETETLRLRQQAVKDRKQIRRVRLLAVALGIFLIAVIVFGVIIWKATQTSRARQLSMRAMSELNNNPDLALLLSVKAYELEPSSLDSRKALLTALDNTSGIEAFLSGHTQPVDKVAISPDGNILASGAKGELKFWNLKEHKVIASIETEPHEIVAMSFNHDGQLLVTGDLEGTLIVWDVGNRKQLYQRRAAEVRQRFQRVDIDFLVSQSNDEMVVKNGEDLSRWDIKTGASLGSYEKPKKTPGNIGAFVLQPGTEKLTAFTTAGWLIVWEGLHDPPKTIELAAKEAEAELGFDSAVSFSPDGRLVAVARSFDHDVLVFNTLSHGQKFQIDNPFSDLQITTLRFNNTGDQLALGYSNGLVQTINNRMGRADELQVGTKLDELLASKKVPEFLASAGHNRAVTSLAYVADDTKLVSGGEDGKVIVWHAGASETRVPFALGDGISDGIYSKDEKEIITCDAVGNLKVWDSTTGTAIKTLVSDARIRWLRLARTVDGKILAAGEDKSKEQLKALRRARTRDTKSTSQGNQLSNQIFIWDNGTVKTIALPPAGENEVIEVMAFSPDGRTLAVGQSGGPITLWDVNTLQQRGKPLALRKEQEPIAESDHPLSFLAFDQTGTKLVSTNGTGNYAFWDLASSERVEPYFQRREYAGRSPVDIAFSHDGKIAIAVLFDRIILWSILENKEIRTLNLYRDESATGIVLSSDDKRFALTTRQGGTIIFETDSGQRLGPAFKSGEPGCRAVFKSDGTKVAVFSCWYSGGIIWNLDPQSWVKIARQVANRELDKRDLE